MLSCGIDIDLSWADPETCRALTFVTAADKPRFDDLEPTPMNLSLDEIYEEKKTTLYIQFELKEFKKQTDQEAKQPDVPKKSVFDFLMSDNHTHYPSQKPAQNTGNVKQFNVFIAFLKEHKFGVKNSSLEDYEHFVKDFVAILWEIDPNYSKLQAKGKRFANQPKKHGHKVKPLSSQFLNVKVEMLQKHLDRAYMALSHMKGLKAITTSVCKAISEYLDVLVKQSTRTAQSRVATEASENSLENFCVYHIEMRECESQCKKYRFRKIKDTIDDLDVYIPLRINELFNGCDNRFKISHEIKNMIEVGFHSF